MNSLKISNSHVIFLIITLSFFQITSALEDMIGATKNNLTTNNWAVLVAGSNGYENYAH